MSVQSFPERRNLLPRWLPFHTSISTGEALPIRSLAQSQPASSDHFKALCSLEGADRSFGVAAEIVSCARVLGNPELASAAAEEILGSHRFASESLKLACKGILGGESGAPELDFSSALTIDSRRNEIKDARRHLRINHRNAIAWIDLARAYMEVGLREKARRCVDAALSLDTSSRFVVRSSARFYVYLGEFDRAYKIVRNCPRLLHDPWIMAAEIGISSLADKGSIVAKKGALLGRSLDINPFHLSELRASLGQLELCSGRDRKARRQFVSSLEEPNENALAHAEWASHRISQFDVNPGDFNVPNNFEALVWDAKQHENWQALVTRCRFWQRYEPFASRPTALGGSVASSRMNDHILAEEITREGLGSCPDEGILRNNLAYYLGLQGRVNEALLTIASIKESTLDEVGRICVTATRGLIAFRSGDRETGRDLYLQAVSKAEETSNRTMAFRAYSNLVFEIISSGDEPGEGEIKRFASLAKVAKKEDVSEIKARIERLEQESEVSKVGKAICVSHLNSELQPV